VVVVVVVVVVVIRADGIKGGLSAGTTAWVADVEISRVAVGCSGLHAFTPDGSSAPSSPAGNAPSRSTTMPRCVCGGSAADDARRDALGGAAAAFERFSPNAVLSAQSAGESG